MNKEMCLESIEANCRTSFAIKIADIVFGINALYESSCYFCKEYLTKDQPDTYVYISSEDIKIEEKKEKVFFYTCEEFVGGSQDRRIYRKEINESCIETVVLHQKIINAAVAFNALFLHGAVVAVGNQAFLFTAPSGTGKTTHIRRWIKENKAAYVVNGDKPILRIKDSSVIVCGTPWCGKENLGTNSMVPLSAVVIMEQSEANRIEKVSFKQAYPFLIPQLFFPDNSECARKSLQLLSQLNGKVDFYKFQCNNFKEDCYDISYNTLMKREHA